MLLLIFHVIFPLMESHCTLKILKNNLRFLKHCYRKPVSIDWHLPAWCWPTHGVSRCGFHLQHGPGTPCHWTMRWRRREHVKWGNVFRFLVDKEGLANLSRRLLTLQRAHQDGEQRLGPRSRESGTPTLCPARSFRWVSPAFIIRAVLCVLIANRRCQILTNGF